MVAGSRQLQAPVNIGSIQETAEFLLGVDVRDKRRWSLGQYGGQGRCGHMAATDGIAVKTAQGTVLVMPTSG